MNMEHNKEEIEQLTATNKATISSSDYRSLQPIRIEAIIDS